ncbi:MAG: SprT-like domain-containing protein [Verrucomicrobia bacterium]|jgi:SprT protein|nr:SprT-like domain-containing protein [Verrucomicrobiota bacterium]
MKYRQLLLDFGRTVMRRVRATPDDLKKPRRSSPFRHDPLLEDFANQLLKAAGCRDLKVRVCWNPRLKTTAGLAVLVDRLVVLNPKLVEVSAAEVQRTLRHELAHLLARHRAGRRRIDAHGEEWKEACADLGIPNEERCHELPFKRRKVARKFFYACPQCESVLARVKPLRQRAACIKCCRKHNGGKYSEKFRFRLVERSEKIAA